MMRAKILSQKSMHLLWGIAILIGIGACSFPWARPTPQASLPVPTMGISPASDKLTPTATFQDELPTETAIPTSPEATAPIPTSTVTPSPTSSPAYPVLGIELSALNPQSLELVAQAGAHWIRRNALIWSDVETFEGERNWGALVELDKELADAASRGLEIILVVQGTPEWAQKAPGYYCGPVKTEKLAAFANFMRDVVARYSQPPYEVVYWELANEPDIAPQLVAQDSMFGCWGDETDPYYGGGYYAEMLKQVYPQIKAANAQAQVLVGGLLADCDPVNPPQGKDCTPSRFLEGILHNGGGDFFDGVSFHAYDYYKAPSDYTGPNWNSSRNATGPVSIPKARYLRSVLNAAGYADKFLMNTEAGLLCGRSGEEAECQTEDFNLTKAYYIAQSNASALAEGLHANIWYSLWGWRGSALVGAGQELLKAYTAYQYSAKRLGGAVYTREVTEYSGVRGYEFSIGDLKLWIVWSSDGVEHPVMLPAMPDGIYDVFGAPSSVAEQVNITLAPIYIDWSQ